MKIIAIVQARMNSSRFPNKVMQPIINNRPMIEILLDRLSESKEINNIVLATSKNQCNRPLVEHVTSLGYSVYEGSENDVLDRYYQIARQQNPDAIVRITGDCPLVDSILVDKLICQYKTEKVDYISNTMPPSYPDG